MGAPQDQGVALCRQQRLEKTLQQAPGLGAVQIAALDLLHQSRAGLGHDLDAQGESVQQAANLALCSVPVVASTPTRPLRVAAAAGFTAGSMPTMGQRG